MGRMGSRPGYGRPRTYDPRPRRRHCRRDDSFYDIRRHSPRQQEGRGNRTRSQGGRLRWIQVSEIAHARAG